MPLMLARGASAETQVAIGTGVFGGMVTGTVLAVLFVPVFFVVVVGLAERRWPKGMTMRALSLALVLAATTACSMTPKLTLPAAPVSPAYPLAPDLAPDGEAVPEWRAMFGDPRLQRLIALALDDNRDLRIAALNAETARANPCDACAGPARNQPRGHLHPPAPARQRRGAGWASTIRHRLSRSASSPRRRR
jgi:hypothetical protein